MIQFSSFHLLIIVVFIVSLVYKARFFSSSLSQFLPTYILSYKLILLVDFEIYSDCTYLLPFIVYFKDTLMLEEHHNLK